jgi:MFS family permease
MRPVAWDGGGVRLYRWRDPPVLALGLLAFAAGFGSFGAVSALGEVAKTFGHGLHGTASIAEQAGLSGTKLGVGLAVLRFASLGGMPLSGLADRYGRRRLLIGCCAAGLALTVAAAASPGYWWFVAIFALGRPGLSATAAVASVGAAEQTSSAERAKALALVTGGYGVGSGVIAGINGLAGSTLGFRGLFLLALVPLAGLVWLRRIVQEPDRFAAVAGEHPLPVLGAVAPAHRRRLLVVGLIAVALAVMTGPVNSFAFIYAENVRGLSGPFVTVMVVFAGVAGLGGLLVGRALADRWGRRPTASVAMVAMAACGVLTYSGTRVALVVGYVAGILAAAIFAPAGGAIANELFPTEVRASVSGWLTLASVIGAIGGLLAFGAIADVADRFAVASLAVAPVPVLGALLFLALPETRGAELEQLAPDGATSTARGPAPAAP